MRTGEPFFRRIGATSGTADSGTTTTLVDAAVLLQEDDFWVNSMVYLPASDKARLISDSDQGDKNLTWLEPLAAAVSTDAYEIWSQFHPHEVHDAISQALRDAWPYFFTYEEHEIVIQEDMGVTYALSSLSPSPKIVAAVLIEPGTSSITGTCDATPGDQAYLKDTDQTFTAADVGKECRIYDGTSKADNRTVSALINANTLEMSANFTTTLDDTSKYRLVDIVDEIQQWSKIWRWSVDKMLDPTYLRFASQPNGLEGRMMRILYEAEYEMLSAESSTTTCPREFLELATMSRLYLMRLAGSPESKLDNFIAMQRTCAEAAESYARKSHYQHLPMTMSDDQFGGVVHSSDWPF